jgi:hypothetical protein
MYSGKIAVPPGGGGIRKMILLDRFEHVTKNADELLEVIKMKK